MEKYDVVSLIKGKRSKNYLKIWIPIITAQGIILLFVLLGILVGSSINAPLADFDQMVVSEGFHRIDLPSGMHFELSYEANHDRKFIGQVRHTSMDHMVQFPILSFDILVTSGDFSDKNLVATSVSDHHFWWQSKNGNAKGTINLLHTIPMNQDIEEKLMKIKEGDTVIIEGWDVQKINAYRANGSYIGFWEDQGCNTTLVTGVTIQ
jgi:hypothetical protein